MKRRIIFILCMIVLTLSACSKNEDSVVSTEDFGSVETTDESTDDKYSVNIEQQTLDNYTYETQSIDKQVENEKEEK